MLNNFIRYNIPQKDIIILAATEGVEVPDAWKKLQSHFKEINFYFYQDTRENKNYIPSIYFHLLSKYLADNPHMVQEQMFLHDSDIVLTRQLDLNWAVKNNTWYCSDTNSYINYDYIQQKGNHTYLEMCKIVDIDPIIPKLMNNNSGGAQYIVNGQGSEFWKKVELDSIKLYDYFCEEEPKYIKKSSSDYPIQKWTAGMWSFIWNAWRVGHPTEVRDELKFGWSTNHISDVDRFSILHNAGVTGDMKGLFFKGAYINKLPYGDTLDINPNKASSFYWSEVQEAGKISVLI